MKSVIQNIWRRKDVMRTSNASLYIGTWPCRPVRLKSSSIKSSETSAKYSWPSREQNEVIHDSGLADEDDISSRLSKNAR